MTDSILIQFAKYRIFKQAESDAARVAANQNENVTQAVECGQ